MKIRKIKITNVRGIENKELAVEVLPNKVNFFVAPNGFGKTSISTAFNSIKRNKLDVSVENVYGHKENVSSSIAITFDTGDTYTIDENKNELASDFSTFVINNQVEAKASTRSFGGFSGASSSLIIKPIMLWKTIPQRESFAYSFSSFKRKLGPSAGKLIVNLNELLCKEDFIASVCHLKGEFASLQKQRNNRIISEYLALVNQVNGTATQIETHIFDGSKLEAIDAFATIKAEVERYFHGSSEVKILVNIIQLSYLLQENTDKIKNINKYNEYIVFKNRVKELLSYFNCTWKDIKAVEHNGSLVIDFPKATDISNGERDILCLVGKLFEAYKTMVKNNGILVIDEIFDYLDDANIIAAQYFLVKMMEEYKQLGKKLFVIVLSHLDPQYFKTYLLSKINVNYLENVNNPKDIYKINKLLQDREKCRKKDKQLYERISSNYLHFSLDDTDDSLYLSGLGVSQDIQTPKKFRAKAREELEKYKSGKSYNTAMVCCGLRLLVEEAAYNQLSDDEDKDEFMNTNGTKNKLHFAVSKGADVPEVHFLLGIIYNEAMHLDQGLKKLIPITCKLRNKVIKKMIGEA